MWYIHSSYRRTDPNGAGVNIGCIDEIDPFEYDSGLVDMKINNNFMSLEF